MRGRVLAALLGSASALALAEGALRLELMLGNHGELEIGEDPNEQPHPAERVPLGRIVRANSNPDIIYELLPHLDDSLFMGAGIHTDANGFRSPRPSATKSENTIRVLGLGDSVMFGWGVEGDQAYLSILEKRLNEAHPERDWEIINSAVPSYNTVQEVEVLIEKGLALEPDLVVLGLVGNDWSLPNFLLVSDRPTDLTRSYLIDWLRARLRPRPTSPSAKGLTRT